MKKVAIMQPYFFPYIGYFQLINCVDTFILFDDVQYIRHGWINRNRVLNPQSSWQYIIVPLEKHSRSDLIRDIRAKQISEWKDKILGQLNHYKRKAPYFDEVITFIRLLFDNIDDLRICRINLKIIKWVCELLDIKKEILVSSSCGFDYSEVNDSDEWALCISKQLGAHTYVNPISGKGIFDPDKFKMDNLTLYFLKSNIIFYNRLNAGLEDCLSIIDVLMFNGIDKTKEILNDYSLIKAD